MPNPLYDYADPDHPLLTPLAGTETGAGLGGEVGTGNAYDALMGYVRRVMATDPVATQKALQDQAAAERQRSVDMGYADPVTGLPTAKGAADIAGQWGRGVMMGTTAPGEAPGMGGLLRDHLGVLTPEASLGRAGMNGPVTLYTTAKNAQRTFGDFSQALDALQSEGWNITRSGKDNYGLPSYRLEHGPTADAAAAQSATEAEKWKDASPVFLRYGQPPQGGRSRNYRDDFAEGGVSVFKGQQLPSGEVRVLPDNVDNYVLTHEYEAHREPLFVVDGKHIGVGSDGEPLLSDVKVVRQVRGKPVNPLDEPSDNAQ